MRVAIGVVLLAASAFGACSRRPSSAEDAAPPRATEDAGYIAGPVDVAATDDPRLARIVDDTVARRVRQITHPSGKGGSLSKLESSRQGDETHAHVAVEWTGGLTDTKYTTTILWTFTPDRHVSAAVEKDTAVVPVADKNKRELDDFFTALYQRELRGDAGATKMAESPDGASTDTLSGGRTELSLRAERVFRANREMTRQQVVAALGPPTWVVLPTDKGEFTIDGGAGLQLLWKNGTCSPVVVDFDRTMKTIGSGDGRLCAGIDANPGPEYSCTRTDRAKHCR